MIEDMNSFFEKANKVIAQFKQEISDFTLNFSRIIEFHTEENTKHLRAYFNVKKLNSYISAYVFHINDKAEFVINNETLLRNKPLQTICAALESAFDLKIKNKGV